MKVKFGAIVVAGSGKLGGHVFAKNRGGDYMRTKVTPLNPQTSRQTAVRVLFAAISSAWSSLTATQRASYEDKVGEYATTNIFGDLKNPSGKSLHQRLNQNLQNTGQGVQTICPDPSAIQDIGNVVVAGAVGAGTMTLAYDGDISSSMAIVFATPPLSQGTKFVKNKLRQFMILDGADGSPENIFTAYTSRYGALVAGQNIHFRVVVVNGNGQASPGINAKATISA